MTACPVTIAEAEAQPIVMIDRTEQPIAQPSDLGSDGTSFGVTRVSMAVWTASNDTPAAPGIFDWTPGVTPTSD